MTALHKPEVITADWFRRHIRDAVRNSPRTEPREIAEDILKSGFTYEEALAAVAAMLPEYVRAEWRGQGHRDRQVPRTAEPVDVFKVEAAQLLTSIPAKTRRRDAAKRAADRRRNAEQLDMDMLRKKFLASNVYGMEHMKWGDLSVEDLRAMAARRRKLALENRISADKCDHAVEVLTERGFTKLRELDTETLLGLGLS